MTCTRLGLGRLRRSLPLALAGTVGGVLLLSSTAFAITTPGYAAVAGRIVDTRSGVGLPAGPVSGLVSVPMPSSIPAGTTADLTVTVTGVTVGGYVSVYSAGTVAPATSNLNFKVGQTVADSVLVAPGTNGNVYFNVVGTAQLIVDLDGDLPASSYTPLAPTRIANSRTQQAGVVNANVGSAIPVGSTVALTITAASPEGSGYLQAYATGSIRGTASNLNYSIGNSVANLVLATVGTGGNVSVYSPTPTGTLVDLDGYAPAGSPLVGTSAARLLDTRSSTVSPGPLSTVTVTLPTSVPTGASAVVLNVTALGGTSTGYVSAYATGSTPPKTSALNFTNGLPVAGLVIVPVTTTRQVTLVVGGKPSQLLVDVDGSFTS